MIADLSRLLRNEFARRLEHVGLPRIQWWLLAYIGRRGGCTTRNMAEYLQMARVAVARQVGMMGKKGLVIRAARPVVKDFLYHLTPQGTALLAAIEGPAAQLREDCFHGLTPERRKAFLNDLVHIRANLLWLTTGAEANPTRSRS